MDFDDPTLPVPPRTNPKPEVPLHNPDAEDAMDGPTLPPAAMTSSAPAGPDSPPPEESLDGPTLPISAFAGTPAPEETDAMDGATLPPEAMRTPRPSHPSDDADPTLPMSHSECPPRPADTEEPTLPATAGRIADAEALPANEQPMPKQIGKFKITGIIAETHLSIVYRAEDTQLPRQVALKLPRGVDLSSPEAQARMRDEVSLAARIDLQSVVPILETGEVDGVPYFVMPLLHGLPFNEHLQSVELELEERITLFKKLCHIVAQLHTDGILHLDIKPANFLVDRHNEPRLLDFGIATTQEALVHLTPKHAGGTPRFMAPEQTYPERIKELTPAADVHALGTILYHMLTGEFPFPLQGSIASQVETIRRARPRPPSAVNREVPVAYDAIVLKSLEKDPQRRYADAGEFERSLNARLNITPAVAPETTAQPARAAPNRGLLIGLVLLVIGGVGVFLALNSGTDNENPRPVATNSAANTITVALFGPADLAALGTGGAGVPELPPELWPLYREIRETLRRNSAYRLNGALLLDARQLPPTARLTWDGGESVLSGQVLALYVPASQSVSMRLWLGEKPLGSRRVAVRVGEVSSWTPQLKN